MGEPADAASDLARRYFDEGHNCAMSVVRAAAETLGVSCGECIPGVGLALGGGVGHTGYACGAVTGAAMAIGLAVDRGLPGPVDAKKDRAYSLAAGFVNRFDEQFGGVDCRTLLGFEWSAPGAKERWRAESRDRCLDFVAWAAAEVVRAGLGLKPGNP
jgi:C_GCAxxG_C_C family probable redox protein